MKTLLLTFIRIYKILLSPWLGNNCRFSPGCADYCAEALHTHGVISGSFLSVKRLLRCHPFGNSGFDPVPSASLFPSQAKDWGIPPHTPTLCASPCSDSNAKHFIINKASHV